jgi:hypothetical protein
LIVADAFEPLPRSRRSPRKPAAAKPKPAKDGWIVVVPVPKIAPPPPKEHYKHGKPSAIYTYHDNKGWELGYIWRLDLKDGGKEFAALTYCRHDGDGKPKFEWRWKSWPEPRPLYGLDRLAKHLDRPVVVVEGEKAAGAAAELLPHHVAVTSPNGSQSAAKADWKPLAGRHVVIWPDADDAGGKYAEAVKMRLAGITASIRRLVAPGDVKSGWDAADALAEGWDHERAAAFIAQDSDKSAPRGDGAAAGEAAGEDSGSRRRPRPRHKDALLDLMAEIELWHSPDGDAYATVPSAGHLENWPVRSKGFRLWVGHQFYERTRAAASAQATEEALRTFESHARYRGAEHKAPLRIGEHGEDLYLDLCDDAWRAVRISATGWSVVERPPVRFIRTQTMLSLPEPEAGDKLEDVLRDLVNVASESDFKLLVAWLVGAFHPHGPYTVLVLAGQHGAAKTALMRLLRRLIDPNAVPDRGPPRDELTLMIAAKNGWVVAFDNLSTVASWFADSMCRLSTGGGLSSREFYTNLEEITLFLMRPQVFTAIPDIVTRPDLADRSIQISLPVIAEVDRRAQEEFDAEIDERRPRILGALLDAVSSALRHRGDMPRVLTRMADFVKWITAARAGLGWGESDFLDAYLANRQDSVETALEAEPLSDAVCALVYKRAEWTGTATQFLNDLPIDDAGRKSRWWPAVNQVKNRLRRIQGALRTKGIVIDLALPRAPGHDRSKLISIRRETAAGKGAAPTP